MRHSYLLAAVLAGSSLMAGNVWGADAGGGDYSPLPSQPDFDIAFGVYGGGGVIEDGDDSYRIFGITGAFTRALDAGKSMQIAGRGEIGLEADSDTYGGVQVDGHLYWNMNAPSAVGLVASLAFDQADDDWNVHGLIGAAAGMRSGMVHWGGQIGWLGTLSTEGSDRLGDAWFARGVVQVFIQPDLKLQGEVGYYDGRFDSDLDAFHMFTAGAELEWKFAQRTSLFVSYDGQWTTDDTWGGTASTYQILAGLRFMLNPGVLQGAATMGPPVDAPNITRLNAIAAMNN